MHFGHIMGLLSKKPTPIVSVIGIRAYPSDFVGTSGVEAYTEHIVTILTKKPVPIAFTLYVKKNYPSHPRNEPLVRIKPIFTLRSRVFETVVYGLLASTAAAFDGSTVVWYQAIGSALFCWLPMLVGKRVIVTLHGLDWNRKKWTNIERVGFFLVSRIVFWSKPIMCAVSPELQVYAQKHARKLVVCAPPGLPVSHDLTKSTILQHLGLQKKSFVLFLGRIVPEKRIDWLLNTWRVIQKENPRLQLLIAGGHGNMPEYEKRLKQRYKDVGALWTGYVFGQDKATLLANCACFVLPSEIEGTSLALLEAVAAGAYCVAARGVIPLKIRTVKTIISFSIQNKQSFLFALQRALRLSQNSKVQSHYRTTLKREYSWEKTATTYERLFAMS